MKFAKVFQQVLDDDHIPEEWVSSAIQYKALKKCINRVVEELEEFGLEKETLQALLSFQSNSMKETTTATSDRPVVSYEFEDDMAGFVPKLTVTIDPVTNLPIDATFAPATLEKIKHIAEMKSSRISVVNRPSSPESDTSSPEIISPLSSTSSLSDLEEDVKVNPQTPALKVVEIKLKSDSEFFYMLTSELAQLDMLKKAQEKELTNLIANLSTIIARVVEPHRNNFKLGNGKRNSDMYIWREIFKEYIEAGIFYSTMEKDSGEHDAEVARQRLLFFAQRVMGDPTEVISFRQFKKILDEQQQHALEMVTSEDEIQPRAKAVPVLDSDTYENDHGPYSRALSLLNRVRIHKRPNHHGEELGDKKESKLRVISAVSSSSHKLTPAANSLLRKFKNPESRPAFQSFWALNNALLQALQFQSINRTAITKILKKFDKQTALTSSSSFPLAISQSDHPFFGASLSKSICFVISERLLPVTPQIDDFLCPICMSLTYKPIRLDCNHIFCVRCLVQLQRSGEDRCPICRQNVVLQADERNLDLARLEYLKLYFPKEAKEKQAETEKQIAMEQMAQLKSSGECTIM